MRPTELPPGYVTATQVEPHLKGAHRERRTMPVTLGVDVLAGVQVIETPRVRFHKETAAKPGEPFTPTLTSLEDPRYFRTHIVPGLRRLYVPDGEQRTVTGPTEVTAYGFDNPGVIFVDYTQAEQSIGAQNGGLIVVRARTHAVEKGKVSLDSEAEDVQAVGHVSHVRVPVDLPDVFLHPFNISRLSVDTDKGGFVFDGLFREPVEDTVRQVEEALSLPVRGILVSPIVPKMSYSAENMGTDSQVNQQGELVLATTYLV